MATLTFAQLREQNVKRCARWHDDTTTTWTIADWSNAMCGEAGELANVVKKIRREQDGVKGIMDPSFEELRSMAADEIADVISYLDLLAHYLGIDMDVALVSKFNRVSQLQHFPERLALINMEEAK